MRIYFIVLILLLSPLSGEAQGWLWATRLAYQHSSSITVTLKGSVYVTGIYDSAIVIGPGILPNHGTFLTKYSSSGDSIWTRKLYGGWPRSIAATPSGQIVVAGAFYDSALVWDGNVVLNGPSSRWGAFVAVFDSNGTCLWLRSDSSLSNCSICKVVIDASGGIYISGSAMGITKFQDFSMPHFGTGPNAFVIKYSPDGDLQWGVNGTAGDGLSVAVDKFGNTYQSGSLSDSAIAFGTVFSVPEHTPGASHGGYVAKFDSEGTPVWIRARKCNNSEEKWRVAVDNDGNVLEINNYNHPHIIGDDTLNVISGHYDLELVKLSSEGDILDARRVVEAWFVDPYDICTDQWGNIFLAGTVSTGTTAGIATFDTISHVCTPYYMPFMAKYNRCGEVVYAEVLGNDSVNYGGVNDLVSMDSTLYVFGQYGNYGITFGEQYVSSTPRYFDCFLAKWSGRSGGSDCPSLVSAESTDFKPLTLFPNPANSNITIESREEIYKVVIYNQFSQQVLLVNFAGDNQVELKTNALPPGVYYVHVNSKAVRAFVKN